MSLESTGPQRAASADERNRRELELQPPAPPMGNRGARRRRLRRTGRTSPPRNRRGRNDNLFTPSAFRRLRKGPRAKPVERERPRNRPARTEIRAAAPPAIPRTGERRQGRHARRLRLGRRRHRGRGLRHRARAGGGTGAARHPAQPERASGPAMRFLLSGPVRLVALLAVALFALAALPAGATVSATNGKIAFGFGDVFTINPDGTQVHQLGVPRSTGCTSWSPDSSKILCNVFGDNGPQPATANPDGSDFTYLNTNLPLDLFCLFWSPDGTRLLCHSEGIASPADAGLYTVRSSDAGDIVRVTATPPDGFDNGYGYSPDGSRILYAQFANHGTLFSVKPDGSDPVQLSPPALSVIDLFFFDRVGVHWTADIPHVPVAALD